MNIGDLKHRVTIESRSDTPDGQGGFTSTWGLFAVCWAKVEPKSARQEWFGDKTRERITHLVTVRARTDIDHTMRIRYLDRILEIQGMRTIEEGARWTEIACDEGTAS